MQHANYVNSRRRWRRKALAGYWDVASAQLTVCAGTAA